MRMCAKVLNSALGGFSRLRLLSPALELRGKVNPDYLQQSTSTLAWDNSDAFQPETDAALIAMESV